MKLDGPLIEHPGSTGQVAELNGARVYIKRPRAATLEHFMNEARFLAEVRDVPGILQPESVLDEPAIVYPYVPQDLVAAVGKLPAERVREVISQLLETLARLHEKGIIHADLKLENVRITQEGQALLSDFGRARRLGVHSPNVLSALSQHYAPDLTTGPSSDIYALGVLAYQLLFGFNFLRDYQLRGRDFGAVPDSKNVDAGLLNFIRAATEVDAGYRLKSAKHARELLSGSATESRIVIEPFRPDRYFEVYLAFLKETMIAGGEPLARFDGLVGPFGTSYFERWSRKAGTGLVRHARQGEDLLGFIEYQVTKDGSGLIGLLHVRRDVRRRGLARRLEAESLAHLEELGVRTVRLNVTEENRVARAYYEALGWRLEGPSKYPGALSYRKDLR